MATSARQGPAALRTQLENGSLAGNWALDPARSTAALRSKHMWGLAPVKGVFRSIEGGGSVSPTGQVTGQIALATGAIDTNSKKRDAHLRSADFFLSEKYPAITFTLDKLVPAGEGVTISGVLTVRENSRPIAFAASIALAGDREVVLDATVHVDRSEFGVTTNKMGMLTMKNTVAVHVVFTRNLGPQHRPRVAAVGFHADRRPAHRRDDSPHDGDGSPRGRAAEPRKESYG